MRRTPSFLMFLTIASVLAPAVALAQPPVVSEPTSTARIHRCHELAAAAASGLARSRCSTPTVTQFQTCLRLGETRAADSTSTGLFGFDHTGTTSLDFGARGWYHVHAASSADFSLGLGLALVTWKRPSQRPRPLARPAVSGTSRWTSVRRCGSSWSPTWRCWSGWG